MPEDPKKGGYLPQPDQIEQYATRIREFVIANQKAIIFAAAAVVLAAVLIAGVIFFQKRAEENAQALLGEALARMESIQRGQAPETSYEELKPEFKEIIEQYGSTDAAKAALLKYADLCYQTGDYDTAIEMYQEALDAYGKDQAALRALVLNGLAYAYEEKQDYDQALQYFNRVVERGAGAMKAQALFNLGRIYGKTGESGKQREVYERIVSDYPDSMYFQQAKENLAD